MGFRSTFTTYDDGIVWPQWFVDKYAGTIHFPDKGGPISAIREAKTYGPWAELPYDIQRAICWDQYDSTFVLVYLHECGGITRCQISQTTILWSEPTAWNTTDGVGHHYCYGCSDV